MATINLTRTSPAATTAVWAVLTDFAAYGRWMPATTMRLDPGSPRPGWGFAGLSGVGPLRLADSMIVTRWEPPVHDGDDARFSVRKTGWVLAGWADVRLSAVDGGTEVRWDEDLELRPAPVGMLARPVVRRLSARMFAGALDSMLEEARRQGSAR
jgi:carbon monoxide dehydrogenase subunit G